MSVPAELSDLDLAALLCSRVCHDVISPVGAIANGLEVLEDEDDQEMRKIAQDLIARSAKQASAKLQFCRIAFGAAGSAGSHIDTGEAGEVAAMFLADEKPELDWQIPRGTRPKNEVKLLLNMLLIAVAAIPRGGRITVAEEGGSFIVRAAGTSASVPEKAVKVFSGDYTSDEFDARMVQVYYTRRLAAAAGYEVEAAKDGEDVVVRAVQRASAAA